MGKHFRDASEHTHDWRKKPGGTDYRINEDGKHLTPVWCAGCSATASAIEEGLVERWPAWRGPVCDVKEEQEQSADAVHDLATAAKRHRAKTTKDGVFAYCCDDGHETFAEALEHGRIASGFQKPLVTYSV